MQSCVLAPTLFYTKLNRIELTDHDFADDVAILFESLETSDEILGSRGFLDQDQDARLWGPARRTCQINMHLR